MAHSYTVQRALRVADRLAQDGLAVEVVDLRSLRPLDVDTVAESVRKTNRALIAEEGWSTYGVGAELAARISRVCFDDLDAPVERVGSAEVPMPYAKPLERAALPLESKIEAAARNLLARMRNHIRGELMAEELVMPRLSDTMEEGTIGRWLKQEGDSIKEGDVLAEIETDKATMEFQAYADGTLLKILVGDGETVALGAPIALIGEQGEQVPDAPAAEVQAEPAEEPQAAPAPAAEAAAGKPPPTTARAPAERFASARSRGAWPIAQGSTCRRWRDRLRPRRAHRQGRRGTRDRGGRRQRRTGCRSTDQPRPPSPLPATRTSCVI